MLHARSKTCPLKSPTGGFLRFAALVLMFASSAYSALAVSDSMNRYSLYGKRGIQIDQYAKTARGGLVGSDVVVRLGGDDTVLAPLLSAGDMVMMNNVGNNWLRDVVRVGRNLTGSTSWHDQTFDSAVFVGRDLGMLQHNNKFKGPVYIGNSLTKETWANTNSFSGTVFNQNGQSVFTSPYAITGVNWGARPEMTVPTNPSAMPWPDTVFTPRAGVVIKSGPTSPLSGGVRRWTCGTNDDAGGTDLVALGICQQNDTILPPGNYDQLDIWFGSTVYVGEGAYSFNYINLQNAMGNGVTTRLLAVQPNGERTVIMTKNGLKVNPSGSFNIIAPEKYQLGYGIDSTHFAGGTMMIYSEASLTLDVSTEIWASVIVPKSGTMVKLADRVHLFGQILADSIHVLNYFKGTDGAFIPYFPDKPVIVSKLNASVVEPDVTNGKPDTVDLKFPITMDHINGMSVRVYYHTRRHAAGTAPADPGVDYLNTSGSIVILPTFLTDTIRVKVIGDLVWEGNETFELVLDSVKNGKLGLTHADSVGIGTIIDNETPPVLSFVKTTDSVAEGASKSLKVKMSFQIGRPLTVDFQVVPTAGFKAVEGTDYQLIPTTKTISFPALTDTSSIQVNAIDDPNYEYPERFLLRLVNSSIPEVLIDTARGKDTVTVLSNDPIPVVTINDTTLMEGQSAKLRASLKGGVVSGDSACFDWKTVNGTALAGSDYVADSGHVCIPSGTNSVVLKSISTLTDAVYEATESFKVQLKPGFGLNATPDRDGTISIQNTNPRPTIRISDVTAKRPATGTMVYTFKVQLVDTAGRPAVTGVASTVSWKTLRGTAVPGLDYDSTGGTFVFSATDPTDSVKTVSVTVRGSSEYHANPLRFTVNLSTDANIDTLARLAKTVGTGTISSAVGAPRIVWIGDTVAEGAAGTRTAVKFVASLVDSVGNSVSSRDPVVFVWSTADSTAKAASPDTNYLARSGVTITIPAGTRTKTDSVMVIGNDLYQDPLRVFLARIDHSSAAASGYDKVASTVRALGGILDADIAPLVSTVTGPSLAEGNSGTKSFSFTVSLDRPSGKPVTYTWRTLGTGTATAGSDFTAVASTTRTIAAGATTDIFSVSVNGDLNLEPDETIKVEVVPVSGLRDTTRDTGTAVILNDDARPNLQLSIDSTVVEGNSGSKALTFRATLLDAATGQPVTAANAPNVPVPFWWRTAGITALPSDNDYAGQSGKWDTIPAGQTYKSLSVTVYGDTRYEPDETFVIRIDTIRTAQAIGTRVLDTARIRNDDAMPSVVVLDTVVQEPAVYGAVAQMVFRVRLSAAAGVPVRVDYETVPHTALGTVDFSLDPKDYLESDSGAYLLFPADSTYKTISVPVYGDTLYEKSQDFYLQLLNSTNSVISDNRATGVILDADTAPAIRISDAPAVYEGAKAAFTVSLQRPAEVAVAFRLRTRNGSAAAPGDFTALDTAITVPLYAVNVPVSVQTLRDAVANEFTEDFQAVLTDIVDAYPAGTSGTGTIKDANSKPFLRIDSIAPVDEADTTIRFTVRISEASAVPVDVRFRTVAGTATANKDYKDTTGLLRIPAMSLSVQLPVRILSDLLDEDSVEWFYVRLDSAANRSYASVRDSLGRAGILDDDPPPSVSISDISVNEPAATGATGTASFAITLDAPSGKTVTVSWRTVDSTAKVLDKDYTAASGSVVFAPGDTVRTISVGVLGDSLDEEDERFKVVLASPVNAVLVDPIGVGTIVDTDDPPFLRINDASVREGSMGADVRATFTVSLERPSAKTVTFHWATRDSTAKSTGAPGTDSLDFSAASGDLTIAAGQRSIQIPVTVKADNWGESPEYYTVRLTQLRNVLSSASDSTGLGTILDGNGRPAVSIDTVPPVFEADSVIRFQVRLQFPRDTLISVRFHTVAGTAVAGEEFVDTTGTVVFERGQILDTIAIRIRDDRFDEPDSERFHVRLDGADSANVVDSLGLATILDDDLPPAVSIADASVLEPAAFGAVDSLRFVVTLSEPSKIPSSVDWRTLDGTASAGSDYRSLAGTVVFGVDDSVEVVTVPVLGDSLDEYDETMEVRLSSPVLSRLADSIGVGTILDNDTAPEIRISDVRLKEPATGTAGAVLRVSLQRPSAKPISFSWATEAGTAVPGADYLSGSGTIAFAPGGRDTSVTVSVLADSVAGEGDEDFGVRLSALVNTLVGDTLAVGTIEDLQGLPGVSIFSLPAVEEKDTTLHFVVKLDWYPAQPVRVWLHTKPGSAAAGVRYVDTAGSILFPAGSRIDSFPVRILNDRIAERVPETFFMVLDSAKTANIIDPVGTATLLDDGDNPPVEIDDADTVSEGGRALFRIRLTGRTKDTVWVWWKTLDGSATRASGDFAADSGMLVFHPGVMQLYAEVPVPTDSVWEPLENFHVYMSRVERGIRSVDSMATGWIRDDGVPPRMSFSTPDTSVVEDVAGDVPVTISLDRPSSVPLKVRVLVQSTATASRGKDYDLVGLAVDTLTVPAGVAKAVFHVRVVPDSIDEYDENVDLQLVPLAPASSGARTATRVTILDDDDPPALVFAVDTQVVREDVGSVKVVAKLARISEKPVSAVYHVEGTATPSVDHDIASGRRLGFSFAPGTDTSSVVFRVIDDNIRETTESVDFVLDSARNASLLPGRSRQVVLILDNDSAPVVSFAGRDTTVPENVGTVVLRLSLSRPSALPVRIGIRAGGTAVLDSLRAGSDAVLDSEVVYEVLVPPMDTVATFSLRVLDDGRVELEEWIDLRTVELDSTGRAGTGRRVRILDNDLDPVVVIVRPKDSVHVGEPRQTVSWTVDGRPMPDSDTTLVDGWNTIVRVFVDTAGNRGSDTVHVWGDFTPPSIRVFKITGANPLRPEVDTTWWGDRARTRFGRDTVWYWVRDSIENSDGGWRVEVDTLYSVTDFSGDGLFPTEVRACDSVRNCAVDTGWIDLKQSKPQVSILTPPEGAQVVTGTLPVVHQVVDGGKTWNVSGIRTIPDPGRDTVTRCYTDDVGNTGCDTHAVQVDPIQVIKAVYVDLDGDGRVDAAIVDLDSKWGSKTLPTFDFVLNDSVRVKQSPSASSPYYSGESRGTPVVNGKDTAYVATGTYLRDARGEILMGIDGYPLTNVLGDTLFGADGKPKRDSLGRVLYKVPGPGKVDSTRLLVPIVPPFPFGMTGFDQLQDAYMTATWTARDSSGKLKPTSFVDSFQVDERVPPVVLKATIVRVEEYDVPDTLIVVPSEDIRLGAGTDWLEVGRCPSGMKKCSDDQLVWTDVPDSLVRRDRYGRYLFPVYPDELGIKPDYRVRFQSGISDLHGNAIDTSNLHWSTVVEGQPRPDLVDVTPPRAVPVIPASQRDRTVASGILIRATNGARVGGVEKLEWWEPGRGYVGDDDPTVRSICPDVEYCNGPKIYVNRPARMIIYLYDNSGTFVATRTIDISQDDLDQMNPDQLDRVSIELLWNHRDGDGQLVASGVYLWRLVSYLQVEGKRLPVMTNKTIRVGVKVLSPEGWF